MSTAIFPSFPGIEFPTVKQPTWATRKQTSISGREVAVADYLNPRWLFTVSYSVLHDEVFGSFDSELRTLMDFVNERMGGFDTFLFTDPTDFEITGQFIGQGDGTTTQYQLIRQLVPGGFAEFITAPNTVSNVYVNGIPTTFTVNNSTGVVTITGGTPGVGLNITADFTYYFRVRFATDTLGFSRFNFAMWELKELKMISVVL